MNEINKTSVIDENKTNTLFKVCFGIFLIPLNIILCFFIYFAFTQLFPSILSFLEHNGKYIVSNLVSMLIIFGLYYFILQKNIYRILVVIPYSIPIFLLPFEPLSLTVYISSFISIIVSHLFIMCFIGFKTLKNTPVKQVFAYLGSILLGFLVSLLIILINPLSININ